MGCRSYIYRKPLKVAPGEGKIVFGVISRREGGDFFKNKNSPAPGRKTPGGELSFFIHPHTR